MKTKDITKVEFVEKGKRKFFENVGGTLIVPLESIVKVVLPTGTIDIIVNKENANIFAYGHDGKELFTKRIGKK